MQLESQEAAQLDVKTRALQVYRLMLTSRYADEKMAKLSKQNKGGTFQLSAAGHELVGVIAGQSLIAGKDWGFPYYRDQPFALGIGADLDEMFGAFLAKATKNHSGGRMMPYHFSHKELRLFCQSSSVGSQFLHAVGRAWAIKHLGLDEVVYVSAGDGATSQGDFHEALNFASLHQLGVIFVIQNNGWAISVPSSEQTAGGSIVNWVKGYAGLSVFEVDGLDYDKVQWAMRAAVNKARQRSPCCVVANLLRLDAHSNSDDPKKYKSEKLTELEKGKDPLLMVEKYLIQKGYVAADELDQIKNEVRQRVEQAALVAESMPSPEKGSSRLNVFAPFEAPLSFEESASETTQEKVVIVDAINQALDEEMELDPYVVVFGEDVARGKGGVFGVTRHLTEKHGAMRCFNTPLAESTIIGIAIGMAADGLHKPIAEIQFADYIWPGINQLFNEASSIYYRSNGEWEVPIVVRMPYGGYIQGGPYHSQSIEGFLAHCPGLKIVVPSNSADAKMLMKTSIRDPNPVLFLEHKGLYRQQKFSARPPSAKGTFLPFGKANVVRSGTDMTLVAWGMMVVMAVEVVDRLSFEGISVEVIDLRTLVPLDIATILASVQKNGKLLIVQEAPENCGFSAEIAARVAKEGFEFLDAPIHRLSGYDSPVPYNKALENEVLPQPSDIELAIRTLLKY